MLWCVTGSGSYVQECVEVMRRLTRIGVEVDVCFSRAGEEVARIYGVIDDLKALGLNLIFERSHSGEEVAGKVASGKYQVVVVAPATSNTVAKVLMGLADTLPTVAVSQALKNRVPVAILPSDYGDVVITTYPCIILKDLCSGCEACTRSCPTEAIRVDRVARIDYSKCVGCGICAAVCPRGAIKCWSRSIYSCFHRDVSYSSKLRSLGIEVFTELLALEEYLRSKLQLSNPLPLHTRRG